MELNIKTQTPVQKRRARRNALIGKLYQESKAKYPELSNYRIATAIAEKMEISYITVYRVINNGN